MDELHTEHAMRISVYHVSVSVHLKSKVGFILSPTRDILS